MADTQKQMIFILRMRDTTKKVMRGFKKSMAESAKAIRQMFKAMKVAVLGFATAILGAGVLATKKLIDITKNLLIQSVQVAGQFEALELQFGVLLGSAEKGKAIFQDLWDVARQLPFTITEIAQSAKQLQAWGVVGNDVTVVMRGLADATALTGQSMDVMARVMGRAWQMGTFYARGPGALLRGLMQDKMNIDITKLSLIEFRKALVTLVTDPRLGVAGMATKLASTFRGIKSMISDAMTDIRLTIAGGEGGLFSEVKKAMEDILFILRDEKIKKAIGSIGDITKNVVREFRRTIGGMFETGQLQGLIKDWVKNVARWGKILVVFVKNLPQIVSAIMNMITTFSSVFSLLFKNLNAVFNILEKFGVGKTITGEIQDVKDEMMGLVGTFDDLDKAVRQTQEVLDFRKSGAKGWVTSTIKLNGKNLEINERLLKILTIRRGLVKETLDSRQKEINRLFEVKELLEKGVSVQSLMTDGTKEQSKFVKKLVDQADKLGISLKKAFEAYKIGLADLPTLTERWESFLKETEEGWKHLGDVAKQSAQLMQSSFQTFFFDILRGEIKSLADYMKSVWSGVAQILAQRMSMQLVSKLFPTAPALAGLASGAGTAQDILPVGFLPSGAVQGGGFTPSPAGGGSFGGLGHGGFEAPTMFKGGGMKSAPTVINNITAMDSKDVYRTLEANKDGFGAFFQNQVLTNQRGVKR